MNQQGPVISLCYMEIVSELIALGRCIPKEVIAEVLSETIEALAKEAGATPRNLKY